MLIIAGGDGTLQEVQKYLHKVVSDNFSIFNICFCALYLNLTHLFMHCISHR